MIGFLGTKIGFGFPWLFAAGAFLGGAALIYAYLRRGRGRKIVVSSVMFLRNLQTAPRARKTFLPPARFFFELFLLIILLAGAAGFYAKSNEQYIVLLDNSLSMDSRDNSSLNSRTLLEEAKEEAKRIIASRGWGSKFEVLVVAPALTSVSNGYVSASDAARLIDAVQIAYAADNLELSLQSLLNDKGKEKVLVLTDKRRSLNDSDIELPNVEEWKNLKSSHKEGAFPNVAIGSLTYSEAGLGSDLGSLEVTLHSYAKELADLRITLQYCIKESKCFEMPVKDEKQLTIDPGKDRSVVFSDLPSNAVAFYAKLEEKRKTGKNTQNVLSADDGVWLTKESRKSKTLLVSKFSVKDLGLNLIPTIDVSSVTPESYQKFINSTDSSEFKSIIFHRFTPPSLPKVASMFIMPTAENSLFPVMSHSKETEVSRWRQSNPILSYVSIAGLRFKNLNVLKVPDWANDIISTPAGVAAFAGTFEKTKYLAFGFELLPFEGKRSPALSILMLNAMKWLAEISSEIGYVAVGSKMQIADNIIAISNELGEQLYQKVPGRIQQDIIPSKPGLLKLETQNGSYSYQAVRFNSVDESDTLRQQEVRVASVSSSSQSQEIKDTKAKLLARIALFLLICDLIFMGYSSLRSSKGVRNAL